jgi:hypothetical protein
MRSSEEKRMGIGSGEDAVALDMVDRRAVSNGLASSPRPA